MKARLKRSSPGHGQQGYALLMVVFLATTMLILAALAAPNVKTEGQREKEKEMIWRGKQYARGVKLYYRKLGRFPTSIDDLTKPKIGSLRFMRQAYKDPMNTQDGSWRLIYVGPAGQLIGSLKPQPQNLMFGQAATVPGMGTAVAVLTGSGAASSGFGSVLGQAVAQVGLNRSPSPGNPTSTAGTPVSADQDSGTDPNASIPTDDPSPIIGGNIIGVGSKVNKKSVIVYDKAKNYRLFEFIWDPSKDSFGMGQPGLQTGTGLGQPVPGTTGAPGVPSPQNPQQTPQNSPPQPQQNPQ